jgi:hypothetical protein
MNRDTQPVTMTDWINAAQTEQRKYANKTVFNRSRQNQWTIPASWNRNTKSNKGNQQQSQRRHPNDQTVPMDIDGFAARKVTTEDEKQRHRKEGRCFECHKTGHMARQCPTKRKGKENQSFKRTPFQSNSTWRQRTGNNQRKGNTQNRRPFTRFESARSAHIEEIEDDNDEPQDENAPPNLDVHDLAARAASFSNEQREEWIEAMKDLGVDFQTA